MAIEGVFSIRLVVVDFYMEKPSLGLDPCYSEFRGKEIKRVPIVRIFGSNGQGQKTCMHVHGVFPYFYIPYEKSEFESYNKAIYQIASNLDKAINISLGQGSSAAQHVFKVQLVKGIPFYGYHRSEHQYLKIYMFNPRFVRRAANLLQNGAVLNKNFHPHEAHVPYILQFMIDFNLYGMSFLHVPLEIVKFRKSDDADVIPFYALQAAQVLNTTLVKKQSNSTLEVDISSNFILNRFQLLTRNSSSKHTNPGIESIWHDEKMRRHKLTLSLAEDEEKLKMIPPLEVPATQERENVKPTESEVFYRTALISKLLTMETTISSSQGLADQTLNNTMQTSISNLTLNATHISTKEQRRTFSLKKLLANAVYPEECSQHDNLINASHIENHLTNSSIFQTSNEPKSAEDAIFTTNIGDESIFLEDTIMDEDLFMNHDTEQLHVPLNASLREQDMALLDVLQQLEENNDGNNQIDLDSSLAALTQEYKHFELTPELLDKETVAAAINHIMSDNDSESENETTGNVHDFSVAMDDIDELILKFTQSQELQAERTLPQVDGADDLLRTPTKSKGKKQLLTTCKMHKTPPHTPSTPKNRASSLCGSPKRSPRTPKSNAALKYAPLPLIITNKSLQKNLLNASNATTPTKVRHSLEFGGNLKSSKESLRKKLAMSEMNRKSICTSSELQIEDKTATPENKIMSLRKSNCRTPKIMDKTHITCSLTPRRRKSERLLKVYNINSKMKDVNLAESTNKEKSGVAEHQGDKIAEISKHASKSRESLGNEVKQISLNNIEKRDFEKSENLNATTNKTNVQQKLSNNDKYRTTNAYDGKLENPLRKSTRIRMQNAETLNEDQLVDLMRSNKTKVRAEIIAKQAKCLVAEPLVGKATDKRKHCEITKVIEQSEISVSENVVKNNSKLYDNNEKADVDINEELEDANEEIPASDAEVETEAAIEKLRKTPNLKRLRKSFRSSISRKPKISHKDCESTVSSESPYNSTKFEILKTTDNKSQPKTPQTPNVAQYRLGAMQSFYENFDTLHSPSIFSDVSSPVIELLDSASTAESMKCTTPIEHISLPQEYSSTTGSTDATVIVTPMDLPPTYDDVLANCRKLEIYEHEFQNPFYSNPSDITKQKEIGHTVLHIPGNKLNDCPEFESVLGTEARGLISWRRAKLLEIGGSLMLNRYRNTQRMREYFAGQRSVIITPQVCAPSRHEAKIWLKARELLQTETGKDIVEVTKDIDDESPFKIRRQKVTMMLNDETAGGSCGSAGDDEDMDCSTLSLTLTPLTPACPLRQCLAQETMKGQTLTPLSTSTETAITKNKNTIEVRKRHFRRAKLSLNDKLKAAVIDENPSSAKKSLRLKCISLERLAESASSDSITEAKDDKNSTSISSQTVLAELERSSFVRNLHSINAEQHENSFGLSCASLNNTFGFKVNLENLQEAKSDIEHNYLTIITLEVFVPTRGDLFPNPEMDAIHAIFYAIENSIPVEATTAHCNEAQLPSKACGYIIVNDADSTLREGNVHGIDKDVTLKVVNNEIEAIEALLELCTTWDADIYAGYEIEMASWGYVIERAKYLCLNIAPLLSRVPTQKMREYVDEERDQFTDLDIEMKLCGRILLDVWRLMRSEIALTSYTFENVMYHIMHKRCPWHSYRALTSWFAAPCSRWIVIEYFLERVRGTLLLLDQLDLIGRTSEMAKLIGIQFYEVLSRGSQFRVESMMLRIAKPKNLVPLSPSVQQRAHMRAPEYLALIMEPQSRFYSDPVIVLDFQSLYPSMIIAYNYCFSTCLGRVEHLGQSTPFEFGASQLRVTPAVLRKLVDRDLITISPCGVVFVKSSVREGILPRMLSEILDTRQMVKQSMKLHKSNSALQRILHSRQLGLKLMANVTYGYTAANFSGRMPAVEVGDSVVSKGRETLERAIKLVHSNEKWNVKVVYGDTDSMFVLVPGRNREEAFKIGAEIAEAVTNDNPQPVKLKLEKVYQPCILQTKKRYVGYMYETADQTEPIYEAKGIETVRRDGCPAVAKMLEKVLRILFESADVSQVKQYVCRQFTKLLSGRANLQDLIFAKEFRGLNGYKPTACVPALELTRKWLQSDPRHIPRRGERVPFIITNGPPGVPLIRLVRSPHEVLADEGLKINAIYYITKAIIPPLNRCLLLIGADVNEWFTNLPRKLLLTPALSTANELITNTKLNQFKKSTISQYFSTANCIIDCGRQTKEGICTECSSNAVKVFVTLEAKIGKIERGFYLTQQICQACCGRVGDLKCASLDCPVRYVLEVKRRELSQIAHYRKLLETRF